MRRSFRALGQSLIATGLTAVLMIGLSPGISQSHPDISEAEDAVAHAIAASPNDPALYLRRATLQRSRKDWDAAAASYIKAADLGADRDVTDVALASVLLDAGLHETALMHADIAIARSPNSGKASLVRARIHARSDRRAQAASDYTHAVKVLEHPEPGVVLEAMQAQLEVSVQDAVELEDAVEHEDDAVTAGNEMLSDGDSPVDVAEQNIRSALAVADTAMAKLGIVPTIQSRAVELETQRGRHDGAVARIDTMLEQAPRHEIWIAERGDALMAGGKKTEAMNAYTKALALVNERPASKRSPKLAALAIELENKLSDQHNNNAGDNLNENQ